MVEGARELSGVSLIRALIIFSKLTLDLITSQSHHLLILTYEFGGGHIQSIALLRPTYCLFEAIRPRARDDSFRKDQTMIYAALPLRLCMTVPMFFAK